MVTLMKSRMLMPMVMGKCLRRAWAAFVAVIIIMKTSSARQMHPSAEIAAHAQTVERRAS